MPFESEATSGDERPVSGAVAGRLPVIAQVITLALVLGALESRIPKDAWRNATPRWRHHASSADHLRWPAANDYPMAAVEEVITEAKDAESVYAQYLAEQVGSGLRLWPHHPTPQLRPRA